MHTFNYDRISERCQCQYLLFKIIIELFSTFLNFDKEFLLYGLSFDLNIEEIIINLARGGIFTPSPSQILQFWEGKGYQSGGKREM